MFGRKKKQNVLPYSNSWFFGRDFGDNADFGIGQKEVWEIANVLLDEPHVLIAGTTGSGKSVFLNSLIWSYLSFPFYYLFIDLKKVELIRYKSHPRTLGYADEPNDAVEMLKVVNILMDDRFETMKAKGQYKSTEYPLYIFIDEMGELITYKGVEEKITRIMRLGRAANIHVIMATQSPNRRVITANIQQNVTCAIALRCNSAIESRQVIRVGGAEKLPRYGYGILWNAEGYETIEIPMTPEEDIINRVKCGI